MKQILYILILTPFYSFGQILVHEQEDLESQISQIHLDKFRWMQEGKLDSLALLLDDAVQYIHSNAWIETKEEVLKNLQTKHLVYHEVNVLNHNVRQFQNTFIVTGQGLYKVSLKDKYIEIPLLSTETYVLNNGGVSLVHRHACRFVAE